MALVAAIDQGTSSSRVIIFDSQGTPLAIHQEEVEQINLHAGWSQMNATMISDSVNRCIDKVVAGASASTIKNRISAVGITNQRETTVVWDKVSGLPLCDAVVWLDTRTRETVASLIAKTPSKSKHHFQNICGLPISTYFSAVKLRWLLDNDSNVRLAYEEGRLMFGTVDSWLIYTLTGGPDGGIHATDVTNASRTMLMNLKTLDWDPEIIRFFGFEKVNLPVIKTSSEVYGFIKNGPFAGIPISGCIGDQQGALLGQRCTHPGDLKNTYGTGCFMLFNTGQEMVIPPPESGLLTTVAYQLGPKDHPIYALEGSIAVAGAAVRWLRDNLGLISSAAEVGVIAGQVEDTGGVYFVPAFSGLYAPYWRDDARGCIIGLTQYSNKAHICRATLESVCWQTKEIVDMMNKSASTPIRKLKVDGGLTASDLCMQLQADILNIPVLRPSMAETTAFGAAIAAGLGVGGCWNHEDVFGNQAGAPRNDAVRIFENTIDETERNKRFQEWKKAVEKSFGSV
ncbi:glycerol kinase-like protein [Obelidium mucronatum]|nr:glycerol kinase-like protein [Obelidium mucronatum]